MHLDFAPLCAPPSTYPFQLAALDRMQALCGSCKYDLIRTNTEVTVSILLIKLDDFTCHEAVPSDFQNVDLVTLK